MKFEDFQGIEATHLDYKVSLEKEKNFRAFNFKSRTTRALHVNAFQQQNRRQVMY